VRADFVQAPLGAAPRELEITALTGPASGVDAGFASEGVNRNA
jgi:hypothetical protein